MKLILLIIFISCCSAFTQTERDSIDAIWKDKKENADKRIEAGLALSTLIHRQGFYDDALAMYKEVRDFAVENKNIPGEIDSEYGWGYVLWTQGNYEEASDHFTKAFDLSELQGDESRMANGYKYFGLLYSKQGLNAQASDAYYNALKIFEANLDTNGLGSTYNNLGIVYEYQGDYEKAMECYKTSLDWRIKGGDPYSIAMSYNNIGGIYYYLGEYELSMKNHRKALELKIEIENQQGIAMSYNSLSAIYMKMAETVCPIDVDSCAWLLDTAKILDKMALAIQKEVGASEKQGFSYINLGKGEMIRSQFHQAKIYFDQAQRIADTLGSIGLLTEVSFELYQVHKELGNYKIALQHFELYNECLDSLHSESQRSLVIKQEFKHEYYQKHLSDSLQHDKEQNLMLLERKKEIEAETQKRYVLYAGLTILLLFGGFIYNRFKVATKQKAIIEEQKEIVEEAHKQITDSINYAERIQRSFLASNSLLDENLGEYFVYFNPKEAVSGDFYWAGILANGNFAVSCADSTGHGVPGAIMSILNISSIEKAVEKEIVKPAEIFNETRKLIIERLKKDGSVEGGKDGMDATLIAFNPEKTILQYVAAHNPVWIIRAGSLLDIKAEKMPVGKHDNDDIPFKGGEFALQKGDLIYTFTDGYQDQFGGDKAKKFKVKPMKQMLLDISELPMKEQHIRISETFDQWKGKLEQVDDVCIVGIKV